MSEQLQSLTPGQAIVFGGDRIARVDDSLAAAFRAGDRLVVVQESGHLLHVPASEHELVSTAVSEATSAFHALARVDDAAISDFFERFAATLEDDAAFAPIATANAADVDSARQRGRSTTRLELTTRMRTDMIAALRMWRDLPGGRDDLVETVAHDGWTVEARRAPLGVVGFVFEGRPNVFADATGVLRTGNTVVFRIGSDALGTARAITTHAVQPALDAAGLPNGSVRLVDSSAHAAGWALFADRRLALAVARGSGSAVAQLGAVARQAGVPVSLHGTGGAWMLVGAGADHHRLAATVRHSLDRKVCNTLNVVCVLRSDAAEVVPVVLAAADEAGVARGATTRVHIVHGGEDVVPDGWIGVRGDIVDEAALSIEWEWEDDPEFTIVVVDHLEDAVALCNRHSPRFTVSVISDDPDEQELVWTAVDAPFVGDGFTRWVDGQFALSRPELGLSNWQDGRLFARAGVLSGDSVHTVRLRVRQDDVDLHR